MIFEKEITVEVDTDLEKLQKLLESHQFEIKEEYDLNDIYMIKKDYVITHDYLDALKHCILIRNIIEENKNTTMITYKYKEYNEDGDIVKDGKINCKIESIEDGKALLQTLGYEEIIRIQDHMIIYANDTIELALQLVNNKHIYIELEEKCNFIDRSYASIEEMKEELLKYNIPIKNNNYFVKKAEIELKEQLSSQ